VIHIAKKKMPYLHSVNSRRVHISQRWKPLKTRPFIVASQHQKDNAHARFAMHTRPYFIAPSALAEASSCKWTFIARPASPYLKIQTLMTTMASTRQPTQPAGKRTIRPDTITKKHVEMRQTHTSLSCSHSPQWLGDLL
jgi:hypothetical protein